MKSLEERVMKVGRNVEERPKNRAKLTTGHRKNEGHLC